MAIIADTGAVYALYDRRDSMHARVRRTIEQERDTIVLPSPILGELDYLLRIRLGNPALLRFLEDLLDGAFRLEPVTHADLRCCAKLIGKYSDLDLGLADASVAAVAERLGTDRILTVDARDFGIIRSSKGKPFRILPGHARGK